MDWISPDGVRYTSSYMVNNQGQGITAVLKTFVKILHSAFLADHDEKGDEYDKMMMNMIRCHINITKFPL